MLFAFVSHVEIGADSSEKVLIRVGLHCHDHLGEECGKEFLLLLIVLFDGKKITIFPLFIVRLINRV